MFLLMGETFAQARHKGFALRDVLRFNNHGHLVHADKLFGILLIELQVALFGRDQIIAAGDEFEMSCGV